MVPGLLWINSIVKFVIMRVVLKKTVVGDSDRHVDSLSESHHQSQVKSCLSVKCYKSGLLKLIGQFYHNGIGCKMQL